MLADTLKALLLLCLIQAARTVADPVKGRAPGSSEQPHRSGERTRDPRRDRPVF